ncbi:MAG: efflux RND transporter periplasmic adaptor subunit [Desulfobacterales bacterium]
MKKPWIIGLVLVVIALLGWQIFSKLSVIRTPVNGQRQNPPVAVSVEPVRKALIRDEGLFTGSLYPQSEFVLAPKIGGRLNQVLIRIGDRVEGGQLVALIDDAEVRQEVIQAGAELEVARATLQERRNTYEKARREFDRTGALRRKKIASESQLDTAESEYKTQEAMVKVAIAQVSQKEAALAMAKVRLSYAQIKVPENHASGYLVVGERFVDDGAMLASNTPIASILDIASLTGVIHVIERDYSKIRPGLEAEVATDAFPGRVFRGKVIRIAPLLKERSRQARVEIDVPNETRELKPGMFMKVRLRFAEHPDATVVPASAVVKRNGSQGVFVVDADARTAKFIPITLGIVNEGLAEVLAPAVTGSVVTLGQHLLEDGAPVLLPDQKSAGSGFADPLPGVQG